MAEFVQTMKEMRRMCAHFRPTCNGCPLCIKKETNEFCGEQPNDIRSNPALVEAAVMHWAAEHPKPVYPMWGQYFRRYYGLEYCKGHEMLLENIPPDIAQKMGLQPKEG